jgi:hypothetical protein
LRLPSINSDGTKISLIVTYKGKHFVRSAYVSGIFGSMSSDPKPELDEIKFQIKRACKHVMQELKTASKDGKLRKARTVPKLRKQRRSRKVR